ncbi:uncharacterized protein LOC112568077 [Pomacea canaliculata]|uniref:uncharacterized protein LOC112568077 n=1 Tax=Pomacea canaliculata TaxID=400727 RepID=UPI000D72C1E1|nr:uncharacterized protein LOC112568077 [Pomacea canaliculata]
MWSVVQLVFVLLVYRGICSQQEICTDLNFYLPRNDVLTVDENDFVNVTFWITVSACNQTNTFHKVTVHTKTNTGIREYDGAVTSSNDTCSGRQSIQCISLTGPATLYKQVNRSHVEIEWELTSIPSSHLILVQKRLNVLYPPVVISLTVNGSEVSGNYLIDEFQEVSISCTFDPGNPPGKFFLFDKTGNEIKATRGEDYLNLSLTLQCEDDWPTVRCEGSGSKTNKSVSFLVRCRPQFIDRYPTVVNSGIDYRWTFKMKVYTTVIEKCRLTSSSAHNSSILVNCTLTGDLPCPLLTLVITENVSVTRTTWFLSLCVEGGLLVTLNFTTPQKQTTGPGLFVGIVLLVIIVFAAFVVIVLLRKRKRKQSNNREIRAANESRVSTENLRGSFSRNPSAEADENNYISVLEVQEKKRRQKKGGMTDTAQSDDACGSAKIMESSTVSRERHPDGLIYGDLDFNSTRPCDDVIDTLPETEYAAINFSVKAPPPRDYKRKTNKII